MEYHYLSSLANKRPLARGVTNEMRVNVSFSPEVRPRGYSTLITVSMSLIDPMLDPLALSRESRCVPELLKISMITCLPLSVSKVGNYLPLCCMLPVKGRIHVS